MPLYEYACDACGHTLEVQQRLAEAPLVTCPSCGKDALQKIISATAFVLKGSGWYKDGYGSSKQEPEDKQDKVRTDNQRTDRLQKAVDDDKKKTDAKPASASAARSESATAAKSESTSAASGSTKAPVPD